MVVIKNLEKELESMVWCKECGMGSNLGFCWKCEPEKLSEEKRLPDATGNKEAD